MVIEKNMAIILGVLLLAIVAFGLDMHAHSVLQSDLAKTEHNIAMKNQAAVQKLARENRAASKVQLDSIQHKLDRLLQTN